MGTHEIAAICATKNRAKIFHAKAHPFLISLGIPFWIGIEESDVAAYGIEGENVIRYPDGTGLSKALSILAKASGAKYILKIDDDVSGFQNEPQMPSIQENIPKFVAKLDSHSACGGIVFPYQQEFYHNERKLFTFMNARLQTAYIIRAKFFESTRRHDPFEDFCTFLEIVDQQYFTLLCPVNKIKCLPVGETPGGLNDGNRAEMGMKAILKMQRDFPSFQIGVKYRPDKSWKVEPDYSKNKALKKIRL